MKFSRLDFKVIVVFHFVSFFNTNETDIRGIFQVCDWSYKKPTWGEDVKAVLRSARRRR
jgi:hypothetical protein